MNLSLNKLPWYWQIGAFVIVCAGGAFAFWHFYVTGAQADIESRQTRLAALRSDIVKGVATARRLPEFKGQVTALEQRLESLRAVLPEEKDVADILRRIQGLALESHLTIQRFTPKEAVQQGMYAEMPFRLQAEGTYHNLGFFFDRIGKFNRIINVSDITIQAKKDADASSTIVAECTATTFVLQEGGPAKPSAK